MEIQKIKLHGDLQKALGDRDDLYILGGQGGHIEGPIFTKRQYEDGTRSVAYCCQDGEVLCARKKVGTLADIEVVAGENDE